MDYTRQIPMRYASMLNVWGYLCIEAVRVRRKVHRML